VSELNEIQKMEDEQYALSVKWLGETVELSDDLVQLYRSLVEIAPSSKVAARDDIIAGLHFMLAGQYHLTIGCLAALRGHLTDAVRSTRIVLELAAFAARVKRHPHLAMVWLNAAKSDEAYAAYREKFATGKIFPDDHALLKEMGNRYDHASKLSHPSVYSMAGQTKSKMSETDGFELDFHYFELKDKDPSEPVRTFLWIVDTHFQVIRLYEEVLAEAIAHDRKAWDVKFNVADVRLAVHKNKWKDVVKPEAKTG
jgi:hypothetical protein